MTRPAPVEPAFAGLADDLAKHRAKSAAAPVTIADCRRTLETLRLHTNAVDRATHVRQYEFLMKRTLVYLASPYSHPDREIRVKRFHAACLASAKLMNDGVLLYSPIAHTHPIAEAGDLPKGWDYWEKYDRAILSCCHKIIVLRIDGWQESKGVAAELKIAAETGIDVEYLDPFWEASEQQ